MQEWFWTSWEAALGVVLSTVGVFVSVIVLTRLTGLRSFSKMSSFDFAMTVAVGSLVATAIATASPPLLQVVVALGSVFGLQKLVALLRQRWGFFEHLVDNEPLLLMAGPRILYQHLRLAEVTEDDLRAKLREANVLNFDEVQAVILETTGDISVLHCAEAEDRPLDLDLLENVRGVEYLQAR